MLVYTDMILQVEMDEGSDDNDMDGVSIETTSAVSILQGWKINNLDPILESVINNLDLIYLVDREISHFVVLCLGFIIGRKGAFGMQFELMGYIGIFVRAMMSPLLIKLPIVL